MIQIASHLLSEHDAALSEYLRGAGRLTRAQWQSLREAIDLMAHSTVTFQERDYTFIRFYETFIDRRSGVVARSAADAACTEIDRRPNDARHSDGSRTCFTSNCVRRRGAVAVDSLRRLEGARAVQANAARRREQ